MFFYIVLFSSCLSSIYSQTNIPTPRIQFYSEVGCEGNVVRDDQGSTNFPLQQYPFESYNLTELWLVQPCNSTVITECDIPIPLQGVGVCVDDNFRNYTHLHLSRRSDDLIQNKINFYSGPRLNGTHDSLTTDINRKNLTFRSLFFTGNYSWTIFLEEEFRGTSYCLEADEAVHRAGYGVTLRIHLNLTMGSLKQGCHGEGILPPEEPEPSPRPTSTNTPNTTPNVATITTAAVLQTKICLVLWFLVSQMSILIWTP